MRRLRNHTAYNAQEPLEPCFAQTRVREEDFVIIFETFNTTNWGRMLVFCTTPISELKKDELLNPDWKYPLNLVCDFQKFFKRATGEELSDLRLRGIRSLLQRKHSFVCEGRLQLQWETLKAIYTCNFDTLEGLLPRIRTHFASNFSLVSLFLRTSKRNLHYRFLYYEIFFY